MNEKYKCTSPGDSIRCNKEYGPTFGGGYDLYLADNANNNNNSNASFATSYNMQVNGANKYQRNQQSYTLFCGATNSSNFKVK